MHWGTDVPGLGVNSMLKIKIVDQVKSLYDEMTTMSEKIGSNAVCSVSFIVLEVS